MATLREIAEKAELKQITGLEEGKEISGVYVCDLLSIVMATGEEGMAWITVQTHLNVLAVACLHEFACVIVPEDISVPQETVDKANEEEIPIYVTSKTAYELCGILHEMDVGR